MNNAVSLAANGKIRIEGVDLLRKYSNIILMGKIVLVVSAVLLIGLLVGLKLTHQNDSPVATYSNSQVTQTAATSAPSALTNKNDSSDSALDKDFQAVQANLNKLDKDQTTANTDSTSQDTPGNY